MKEIFIWGSSSHAQCILNITEQIEQINVAFFFDPTLKTETSLHGYDVISDIEKLDLAIKNKNISGFAIGIGDNYVRKEVYKTIKTKWPNLNFETIIHPSAKIEKRVILEPGVLVMGGAFLETGSHMGKGSWIGVNASLGFNNIIGDFSSIAVNSCLGGNVSIGNNTAITMSVTVLQKRKIGNNCVIGSGSLVTKDIPDNVVAYGLPAKIIRTRQLNEKYL